MTIPSVDTLASYGGALSDYHPVVDSTTDRPAAGENQALASVAGMTHTALRAWCRFLGHATAPTDPANNVHDAVWGNGAPVKPVVAHSATGVYTITWPVTITDELGNSQAVNLRACGFAVEGATLYLCTATVTSANVVTLRVFNTGFAANDAVGVTFLVWAV